MFLRRLMDYKDCAGGVTESDMDRLNRLIGWEDIGDRTHEDCTGLPNPLHPITYYLIPWLAHHKSILAVIILMAIMFILWPVDTNIK
jgi:hypothetical protein